GVAAAPSSILHRLRSASHGRTAARPAGSRSLHDVPGARARRLPRAGVIFKPRARSLAARACRRPAMAVSPVTAELINGALNAAIHEMETLINRTAMSAMIKEKKDFFVGLFDARGRLLAAHVSFTAPGLIEPVLRQYPLETIRPGDVFWYNDPYLSQGAIQHLGDMVFIAPVFDGGEAVAFSATFGHFRDIGGTRAGSISPGATEIFHEGTRVPPIRIFAAGVLND